MSYHVTHIYIALTESLSE